MKLYIFRTVRLVIISSLFTVHSAMVYVIHVCRELSSRTWSCSKAVYKHVWHIPLLIVQWINCWWWPDELSETCRVSWQNKFVKLVHLVGFITKKFVTMHGHMSRCTVTCYDARSHVTMHGHMSRCTVTCYDARSHERINPKGMFRLKVILELFTSIAYFVLICTYIRSQGAVVPRK